MYNRYIPQPDGSYRRNSMPDKSTYSTAQKQTKPKPPPCPPPVQSDIPSSPAVTTCHKESYPQKNRNSHNQKESDSITGFFKHLLPRDLDTGDLLIILLLLLMAGDCKEDKNSALLTLALYFFM